MWTNIENIFLYTLSMGAPAVLLIIVSLSYLRTRHRERLAVIEKNGELPKTTIKEFFPKDLVLKVGLFLIGISFGILAGFIINHLIYDPHISEETAYFITIPFFTGLSLIFSYLIKK